MRTAFSGCLMEAKSNPWDSELLSRGDPSGQNWAGKSEGGLPFSDQMVRKRCGPCKLVASNALMVKRQTPECKIRG
jgi:hypothetical protein